MSVYNHACPPVDCGPCGTLPPGFVRLRYFYGKRLGVVDFLDEQRYHAGKLRFHNQRLHGAGVLCGLATDLFAAGETVLRITKGAALDGCGREVIVGYDQCIDVDAWYVRWRAEMLADDPAWTPPVDGDLLRLCVTLRFRECPSGIEPAPRDPCACDASGSDYGRVREEFELELAVHEDATAHVAPPIAPPRPGLDLALGRAVGGGDLAERLRALLHAGCADADPDGRLVLACFAARLDAAREHVTALEAIESVAAMLYSSALLEVLVGRALGPTLEAGAWAAGAPEVDVLTVEPGDGTAAARITIALTGPVLQATAENAAYRLRELTTTWIDRGAPTSVTYADSPSPAITLEYAAGALPVGRYRLSIAGGDEPIVDDQMRALVPLRPSFHFRVIDDGGVLVQADPPYAEASP